MPLSNNQNIEDSYLIEFGSMIEECRNSRTQVAGRGWRPLVPSYPPHCFQPYFLPKVELAIISDMGAFSSELLDEST